MKEPIMNNIITKITDRIATESGISVRFVSNVVDLLKSGATVPFIARYRKEKIGSLDEVQITSIRDLLNRFEELEKRRTAVINSVEEQNLLTPELKEAFMSASTMAELEDLYLPFKPKRKTRASIAKGRGLEPLAKIIMAQRKTDLIARAKQFVDPAKEVLTIEDALAGARDIIAEWANEDPRARARLRRLIYKEGIIISRPVKGKEEEGEKYQTYFEWSEPARKAPSHRILAMFRGEKEGLLHIKISPNEEKALMTLENLFLKDSGEASEQVQRAVHDAWKRLLHPSLETELRNDLKEAADKTAIRVFAENLRQLLLASPLGQKRIMAIDPGFRSGCKIVCLDEEGRLLHNENIYPHPPVNEKGKAINKIQSLVSAYNVEAIAIGNGTAGRETEQLIRKIRFDKDVMAIMVNESGASVYSASDLAREEFPDYDVTVRGAVSIGRRLADPLSELVKIDPKSIGVGQYQHDVDQKLLRQALDDTVTSCVNAVGVELNTASKELLTYVSGVGPALAASIVNYRNASGAFNSRNELMQVPRLGAKAFEQAAGFIRVTQSDNPLDSSAVHPESYWVVEKMAADLDVTLTDLIRKKDLQKQLDPARYVSERIGLPTLKDIMQELARPGRDPRKTFDFFEFDKSVKSVDDLREGMVLPGIITNITAFGAFADIGIHHDGLIHISELANRFVRDPAEVVTLNQKVMVKVLSVEKERKRISLSIKQAEINE